MKAIYFLTILKTTLEMPLSTIEEEDESSYESVNLFSRSLHILNEKSGNFTEKSTSINNKNKFPLFYQLNYFYPPKNQSNSKVPNTTNGLAAISLNPLISNSQPLPSEKNKNNLDPNQDCEYSKSVQNCLITFLKNLGTKSNCFYCKFYGNIIQADCTFLFTKKKFRISFQNVKGQKTKEDTFFIDFQDSLRKKLHVYIIMTISLKKLSISQEDIISEKNSLFTWIEYKANEFLYQKKKSDNRCIQFLKKNRIMRHLCHSLKKRIKSNKIKPKRIEEIRIFQLNNFKENTDVLRNFLFSIDFVYLKLWSTPENFLESLIKGDCCFLGPMNTPIKDSNDEFKFALYQKMVLFRKNK